MWPNTDYHKYYPPYCWWELKEPKGVDMARHAPIHKTCANPNCDNPIKGEAEETVMDGRFYCCPECAGVMLEMEREQPEVCAHCGDECEATWQDNAGEIICEMCAGSLLEMEYEQPEVCAADGNLENLADLNEKTHCEKCGHEFVGASHLLMDGDTAMIEVCDTCYRYGYPAYDCNKDPKSRYYDAGGFEVLDIIRVKLTPEQWRGYLLGNLIKYTCRANWKGDFERDSEKISFYANYMKGGEDAGNQV